MNVTEHARDKFYDTLDLILANAGLTVGVVAVDRETSTPDRIRLRNETNLTGKEKAAVVTAISQTLDGPGMDDYAQGLEGLLGLAAAFAMSAIDEVREKLDSDRKEKEPAGLTDLRASMHRLWDALNAAFKDVGLDARVTKATLDHVPDGQDTLYFLIRGQSVTGEFKLAIGEEKPVSIDFRKEMDAMQAEQALYAKSQELMTEQLDLGPAHDKAAQAVVDSCCTPGRLGQVPARFFLPGANEEQRKLLFRELHQNGFISLDTDGELAAFSQKAWANNAPIVRHTCPRGSKPNEAVWTLEDNTCSFCGSMNPDEVMGGIEDGSFTLSPTDKPYKVYVVADNPNAGKNRIVGSSTHKTDAYTELTEHDYLMAVADGACRPQDYKPGDYVLWGVEPKTTMRKFYFMHLSEEQQRRFVELLNEKKVKIGDPGRFYVKPYFIA